MPDPYGWLPPLHTLDDFQGDTVSAYLDDVYYRFRRDLVESWPPPWEKKRFFVLRHPSSEEREAGFWHCITEGQIERDRTPNLQRCARITWIRAIIEAVRSDRVVWWKSWRKRKLHRLIALPDFSYVVILAELEDRFLLLTAYPVEYSNRKDDFRREYEQYWRSENNNAAP